MQQTMRFLAALFVFMALSVSANAEYSGPSSGGVGSSTSGQVLTNSSGAVAGLTTYATSGDLSIGTTGINQLNKIQGVAVGVPTGTGAVVLATSPSFPTFVGIGTIAPTSAIGSAGLAILGTSTAGPMYMGQVDSNHNGIWMSLGTAAPSNTNFAIQSGVSDQSLTFNVPTGNKINLDVNGTKNIIITAGGITIGSTTTGSSALTTYGNGSFGTSFAATAAPANGLIVQGSTGIGTSAIRNGAALDVNGGVNVSSTTMLSTTTAFTNNAGSSAGTITNAPAVGNPTKWIPINDNGTIRNIPAW